MALSLKPAGSGAAEAEKAASLMTSPSPGQKPTLVTSWEEASFVVASAFWRTGARRPEKRETARSKLPQKKWTGLDLPTKPARNFSRTGVMVARICQKRCAY